MSDPRPPRDEDVDAPAETTTPVASAPADEPEPTAADATRDRLVVDPEDRVDEPAPVAAPAEPVALVEPAAPVPATSTAVLASDADYDDDADTEPEVTPPVPAVAPIAHEPSRVVYVEAPRPPKRRGNRGFGAVMALLSTLVFAGVYLGLALAILGARGDAVSDLAAFALSGLFLVPVGAFALFSVLLTLVVNRAPWWVHVLGSLVVGVLVYATSIGVLLLLSGVVNQTPEQAALQLAFAFANPIFTVAGLVAREVSLWVGLGIAARGRRVKARNIEAREAFEREQAEARAAHDRGAGAGYPVTP